MSLEKVIQEGSLAGYSAEPEDGPFIRLLIEDKEEFILDLNLMWTTTPLGQLGIDEENVNLWLWGVSKMVIAELSFREKESVQTPIKLVINSTNVANGQLVTPWRELIVADN